jgi:hypothetical protein
MMLSPVGVIAFWLDSTIGEQRGSGDQRFLPPRLGGHRFKGGMQAESA